MITVSVGYLIYEVIIQPYHCFGKYKLACNLDHLYPMWIGNKFKNFCL